MVSAIVPKLFTPFNLGGKKAPVELKHRRATDGGLLVTEATNISSTARGYFGAPGIFSQAQIDGWVAVTKAVHAKGGKIFVQLWHTGRVGHPMNQPDGQLPVSSSATRADDVHSYAVTREGRKDYVTPRAAETRALSPTTSAPPRTPLPRALTAWRSMRPMATSSSSSCATA
ncbi:12-oxophytodienoate reductase 1 [Phytophthora pseudosyringae]|uniref:12-oxophytodienoate reductase 1 n=1 Tax=Phytophthora pseudosyringae TaxID=221518 RepID=A0A8T1V5P1_9STRA|nr:12-oxophytodienoate reductase 1 [Phytophthora pseudosyringae]